MFRSVWPSNLDRSSRACNYVVIYHGTSVRYLCYTRALTIMLLRLEKRVGSSRWLRLWKVLDGRIFFLLS